MFRFFILVAAAAFALTLTPPAQAQQLPALSNVSANVAAAQPGLLAQRENLQQERNALHAKVVSLNSDCSAIDERNTAKVASCTSRKQELQAALASTLKKATRSTPRSIEKAIPKRRPGNTGLPATP